MRNQFIVATMISMLAGCAPFPYTEVPLTTNFETSKQLKIQAAHHWQVIANDTADTLAEAFAKGSTCVIPSLDCPRLYVVPTSPNSSFGKGFRDQFLSRLVNRGLNVVSGEPVDIAISINAQTVKFSADRSQYLGAGRFSLLTTGLWGLHEIDNHSGPGAAVVSAGVMLDVLQWNMAEFAKGPTPQIELILTTSATRNSQYVARTTNVYYIADSDAALYCWNPEGCDVTRTSISTSSTTRPTISTSIFSVVGDCGFPGCTSTGLPPSGGLTK